MTPLAQLVLFKRAVTCLEQLYFSKWSPCAPASPAAAGSGGGGGRKEGHAKDVRFLVEGGDQCDFAVPPEYYARLHRIHPTGFKAVLNLTYRKALDLCLPLATAVLLSLNTGVQREESNLRLGAAMEQQAQAALDSEAVLRKKKKKVAATEDAKKQKKVGGARVPVAKEEEEEEEGKSRVG